MLSDSSGAPFARSYLAAHTPRMPKAVYAETSIMRLAAEQKGDPNNASPSAGAPSPSPHATASTQARLPLRVRRPPYHISQWQGTGVPEPVFSYDGLYDPHLQQYFGRSGNARRCLVGHGVVTTTGDAVHMHHAGGRIWLAEKRYQQREARKLIEEERAQAAQMRDRQRHVATLAQIERSGRVNRMRVAEHVAYARQRQLRHAERQKAAAKFANPHHSNGHRRDSRAGPSDALRWCDLALADPQQSVAVAEDPQSTSVDAMLAALDADEERSVEGSDGA